MKARFFNPMMMVALVLQMGVLKGAIASSGAHVHGLSELTIAFENKIVEIQLTSPAADVVGFEHKAHSKADKQTVMRAKSQLDQEAKRFSFQGDRCVLVSANVDTSSLIETEGGHHHDHHHHDDHKHHQKHTQHAQHSEVMARYQYRCDKDNALTSITVNVFDAFSGVKKINAMWINHTKQGAQLLTPKNRTLIFRN